MNTYLLIYLIGVIVTFTVCKIVRYRSDNNEWNDVGYTLLLSVLSVLGLFFIIILIIVYNIIDIINDKEPPKWL